MDEVTVHEAGPRDDVLDGKVGVPVEALMAPTGRAMLDVAYRVSHRNTASTILVLLAACRYWRAKALNPNAQFDVHNVARCEAYIIDLAQET